MIGQLKNKETLIRWRLNRAIPRSIIIEGDYGSGRLTFSKEILKTLNATGIIQDTSKESVNNAVENAYMITEPTCFIFRDIDTMSVAGANALLKVIEEPPNNASFILTCQSLSNVLDTIKSRCAIIKMQPYTIEQLRTCQNNDFALRYINTIYEAKTLEIDEIERTVNCADRVVEALNDASGTKLLKEMCNLKSKETDIDLIDCAFLMKVLTKELKEKGSILTLSCFLQNIQKYSMQSRKLSVAKKPLIECVLFRTLEGIKNAKIS